MTLAYISIPELARRAAARPGILEQFEAARALGCDEADDMFEIARPLRYKARR